MTGRHSEGEDRIGKDGGILVADSAERIESERGERVFCGWAVVGD